LNSGKRVDSGSATDSSNKAPSASTQDNNINTSASESSSKAEENKVNSSSNQSSSKAEESNGNSAAQQQPGTATPSKKKGRFHLLKKIVKPI
jgi:hypothetical protein